MAEREKSQNEVLTKNVKLMTEKEKEDRQLAAVPVGPHGNAPLAAFRGGEYRQSDVVALQLRGHLLAGLRALPPRLPLLVRPQRDSPSVAAQPAVRDGTAGNGTGHAVLPPSRRQRAR